MTHAYLTFATLKQKCACVIRIQTLTATIVLEFCVQTSQSVGTEVTYADKLFICLLFYHLPNAFFMCLHVVVCLLPTAFALNLYKKTMMLLNILKYQISTYNTYLLYKSVSNRFLSKQECLDVRAKLKRLIFIIR